MTFLSGRSALVTGAGNGLGAAIARGLAAAGAQVVLAGRTTEKLDRVRDDIGAAALTVACDVSDAASVQHARDALADQHISILINNAGIPGPVALLSDIEPDDWDEVFAINVRGTYLMCRAFLPDMVARGRGDVLNIASVSGKRPLPGRTPYCASKMAVIGLTSTLAFEVGPHGVNVNALSPGPVDGPRMERNFRLTAELTGVSVEQARHDFVSRAALGRMVTEDEVAGAALRILQMPGLSGADIDLSAGMIA